MPTYLQPVYLPNFCFLYEALYWVAFQRLPISTYTFDGEEYRLSDEVDGYEAHVSDSPTEISDEEAKFAGIPPDPYWAALMDEERSIMPSESWDVLIAKYGADSALLKGRADAVKLEEEAARWKPHYQRFTEYPRSQIYVALRSGQLKATGRLLPSLDFAEAHKQLSADDRALSDIAQTSISADFWTLQGINFEASAAKSDTAHYCHIMLPTEGLIEVFPGRREEIAGVERVGDSFVLGDKVRKPVSARNRGRPAYPWEAFHLEVASLLKSGGLPSKKEAAIQYFQSWFEKTLGVQPSRAAVGEKLKPYYDKFGARTGQKIP
jgi:hypothetical protein